MTTTLNPSIVGQTEKVHTAILARALEGTALDETQWITLNLAIAADGIDHAQLVQRVTAATKRNAALVEAAITALEDRGLLATATVTDAGRELVGSVRAGIAPIVARAYGQVAEEDLAVAARALTIITAALSQELAA